MDVEGDRPSTGNLQSREPTLEDLRDLCRARNDRRAKYLVIGGFAIRAAGYNRRTMDVDLLVATDPENEGKVAHRKGDLWAVVHRRGCAAMVDNLRIGNVSEGWCGREDLNLHDLAATSS